MTEAGVEPQLIAAEKWFNTLFHSDPALQDITVSALKRNFGRCRECTDIEALVQNALKGHDRSALRIAKAQRLNHVLSEKSDKQHYYMQREVSRDVCGTKLTMIIDKMDSAKNTVPYFTRPPKYGGVDDDIKNAFTSHIVGVIVHGRPDKRYFFAASQQLTGDANLNIDCIRRVLSLHAGDGPLRPELYVQVDNASDNKNKTLVGFLAFLVLNGYIRQAEIAFMMVGHTHEDIDACFRIIAEYLYSIGLVRNIEEYLSGIKLAWARGEHADHVHVEKLDVIFDYKTWLDPHVYNSDGVTLKAADEKAQMSGITTARYFLIRKRADGAVALWYKPQVAHPWLYPSKKDATGAPMFTMVDGEKQYDQVCENGIEIFHTPQGPPDKVPPHAEFPLNKRLGTPFLNVDEVFAAAKSMIEHMPAMFGLNALEPWQRFQREHPRKLADVPDAARPAWQLPPTLIADAPLPKPLFEQLKEYNETIQYTNPTSKTIYTNHKSRGNLVAANLANEKIPDPVRKGEMLFVKAEQGDETFESNQFAATPLWACQACDEEPVPTNSASARTVSDEDVFNVAWWACFKSKTSLEHPMSGKWKQLCVGCDEKEVIVTEQDARIKGLLPKGHKGPLKTIKKVFHAWEPTCGRKKGHGAWAGQITRNMIRLYAGAVTNTGEIEEKKSHSKQHLYELLGEPACPSTWKPKGKKTAGTKSTRRA
mmetsp:Transcript_12125/g.31819  ORF Transcript_12125/g.31819 Transcript_12125/m.31819 type:complete len:706 (+) Transcript_12125:1194-3311(+)